MEKREIPHHLDQDDHYYPKRTCHSFPSGFGSESVTEAKDFSDEICSYIETFLRPVVREEVEKKIESYLKLHQSSSSQLNDGAGEEVVAGSGLVKHKLSFLNQIASIIFANNEIEAENGEPLQIALCDTTNFNSIVQAGPLSSALIEFVVVDGEFGSGHREEEILWNVGDFEKSVLTEREGKRPLIVGENRKVRLKNGVAFIKHLSFTDNSSWRRSKKFRLGVRIIDNEILAKCPRIGEAVSKPFRVMDHRGEVIKKHHPPKGEDEVWRLEGIGKDGEYHKRLSSVGIESVDGFVRAYKKDARSLRKLLGNKVSNKTWNAMVDNALECVSITTFDTSFGQILVENEGMGGTAFNGNSEVGKPKINPSNSHGFSQTFFGQFQDYDFMFEDYPELLLHGEASTSNNHSHKVENTRTCNKYYQETWTK